MNKFIRLTLTAGAALAIISPANADHAWSNYHWAGAGTELPLKINLKITSQWTASVNRGIADWNQSTELALTSQTAPAATTAKRCNPIAGQVLVCNYTYGQRGWLGIASVWLSNGHISQATTKLNDSYFNSASYNTPAWRALVACQEIGHDFGLGHQDEGFAAPNLGSCMDYTDDPDGGGVFGPSNEHPNDHDLDQLKTIYNHDDGFTTSTAGTNFGIREFGKPVPQRPVNEEAVGDSPSEWGRAIHKDGAGRPDLFEKDIAQGRKMITHVFWAIGEGPQGGQHD